MARVSRGRGTLLDDDPLQPAVDPEQARAAALRDRLVRPMPPDRLWGWVGTLFVGTVTALLRLVNLGRPDRLVFDETYYAKDAFSLLRFGYARGFVDDADEMIIAGELDVFTADPSFVVHPPGGKWLIAGGIQLLGMEPTGWRLASALAGVITAMIVVRAGRRLFRSTLLGSLAGLLVAVDGMSIAVSRVAILDGIMTMFIAAAFAFLLLDRDQARARYAEWAARMPLRMSRVELGPLLAWRPWRLVAGVALGLACATKWSGLFAVAAFGLLSVLWEVGSRRAAGVPAPWTGGLLKDGPVAFLTIMVPATAGYVASWGGWVASDNSWSRNWAAENPPSLLGSVFPDWARSLWHYHAEILYFHSNLDVPHDYESPAWGWLLLMRPVSFDYVGLERGEQGCAAARCSQEILALGNPVLWWGACAALLGCLWMWLVRRDWRAGAILAGMLATWVPWLFFPGRTTFAFYAVAIVPFLALAVTYALGLILGPRDARSLRRTVGATAVGAYVLCVIVVAAYFYPIHVDAVIPYQDWAHRMWFHSWI
jgi:dolichyl-phosphate-mannose-protein mannosyltransferase